MQNFLWMLAARAIFSSAHIQTLPYSIHMHEI